MRRPQPALALAGVVLSLGLGAASASATPPLDDLSPLVDEAGVLSSSTSADVEAQISALSAEHQVDLHLVFVDSFDGLPGPEWADQTFDLAGLEDGDILVAVAVQDRRYGYVEQTELSDGQTQRVAVEKIEPALRESDWDAAATAATTGFQDAVTGFNWWLFGGIWAAVLGVLGGVGAAVLGPRVARRRRDRRARAEQVDAERARVAELVGRTRELADRAEQEQAFVELQLGDAEAERLRTTATEAATRLDRGVLELGTVPRQQSGRLPAQATLGQWQSSLHSARQSLEDAHRRLSLALEHVDLARSMQQDTSRLDDLTDTVEDQVARADAVESRMAELDQAWLRGRVSQLLTESRESLRQARSDHAASLAFVGQQHFGKAAHSLLSGEQARQSAQTLLDRAEHPAAELEAALRELRPQETSLRRALDEARRHRASLQTHLDRGTRLGLEQVAAVDAAGVDRAIERATSALQSHPHDPPARAEAIQAAAGQLQTVMAPVLGLVAAVASSSGGRSQGARAARRRSARRRSSARRSARRRSSRGRSSRSRGGGRF